MARNDQNRVLVAMSGGVDSSVAVLLLIREGYDVIGVTAKLLDDDDYGHCCSIDTAQRARRTCDKLGIRHHVTNLSNEFREQVITRYVSEYTQGRTPNPCIDCNRFIKFSLLLKMADTLECGFLATGHYARIAARPRETFAPVPKPVGDSPNALRARASGLLQLMRGVDSEKDQSYFLAATPRSLLPRLFFPCGDYTKEQVRAMAAEAELPTVEAEESQDICFVTKDRGLDYWLAQLAQAPVPGDIRDLDGDVVGKHDGIEHYTRGQRKGLRLGGGPAKFVVDINADTRELIVGEPGSMPVAAVELAECNILTEGYVDTGRKVLARTRYRQRESEAVVESITTGLRVRFNLPQEYISPGQWCVFYDGEVVIGGGVISSVVCAK
jgi:tRNA-uridine 2-sulfurtransferase